jgi:hypothetical protein
MKQARRILYCFVLIALGSWAGTALAAGYLNLAPGSEQWYVGIDPGNYPTQRMHTTVTSYDGDLVRMHREFWNRDSLISQDDRIFSSLDGEDIFYHGTLQEGLFKDPVLWVDAPLVLRKTWVDSRPLVIGPGNQDVMVHYVFAVLDKSSISCPVGTFECYRVSLTEIYPDGRVENCSFWYNEHCGLVRCCMQDSPIYNLVKAIDVDPVDDPNYEVDNPFFDDGLIGGLAGVPNPANPMTQVTFELREPATVQVEVFDIAGRLVRRLARDEFMPAGTVSLRWQGSDELGRSVASGTYLFRVKVGQEVSMGRVTLVR